MKVPFNILILYLLFFLINCSSDKPVTRKPQYAPGGEKHKNVFDEFGQKQGLHKFYSRDGVLIYEIEYVDNKKHGSCKKYFSETGKIREESNYFNGKKDGEFKKYNTRDKMIEEGSYKAGKRTGRWVYYYNVTGEIKMEGEYKDGKANGEFKYYTAKGSVHTQGSYVDGKRNGDWDNLDSDGNVIKTEKYKDGIIYDPNTPVKPQNTKGNPVKTQVQKK